MKKPILLASSLLLSASLFAAGDKVVYEPVAEGYCAWAGLTAANHVFGRSICPSDLRHKLTAVVFVDANDYEKHLSAISRPLRSFLPSTLGEGTPAESMTIPRDSIGMLVCVGKLDAKKLTDYIRANSKEIGTDWIIYKNVTGSKVPDNGGKLPFYCVFKPEGGDPIASGEWGADSGKKLLQIRNDKKIETLSWKPYYGTVEEPQFMKSFTKTLKSGKPLESLTASCKKGITSKNPEQAKECQILYDALEQTRSDYLYDIVALGGRSPTRAYYEAQILIRQWPKSKKSLKGSLEAVKSIPEIMPLCKMFTQIKTWGSDDFQCKNAGEAKKIETELKKMKATCDKIVETSSNAAVQSCAAWLASEADALAPLMSAKVPVKP